MKKIFTLVAALMLSAGIFADTVPWNCFCDMYSGCDDASCYYVYLLPDNCLGNLSSILQNQSWDNYDIAMYNFTASDASDGSLGLYAGSEGTDIAPVVGSNYFALFIVNANDGSSEATHYLRSKCAEFSVMGCFPVYIETVEVPDPDNPGQMVSQTMSWTALPSSENVPEPTSGLFLLLGVSILALKRKK